MIRINQIKLKPNHSHNELRDYINKKLRINNDFSYEIVKRSLDGRDKPYVKYIYSINVKVDGFSEKEEKKLISKIKDNNVIFVDDKVFKYKTENNLPDDFKVVIVGSGPAGLFCAYALAKAGVKPVVIERGSEVTKRSATVEKFWADNNLDTECNVQFGEGGAGTFSDGKLNTQVKDENGYIKAILKTFVEFGAKEEIIYDAKPHIGTDILCDVVKNMRNEIISMGGEFFFDTKLVDIVTEKSFSDKYDSIVTGVKLSDGSIIKCDRIVLAIGHSARDTFIMLNEKNINIKPKAFALGVRIEHPQGMINDYAYGENIYELPSASYKVTYKALEKQRGVYSFCMCPGGYVVNASSEENRLCVNGMSYSDRNSANANSAIVVTVTEEDYDDKGPLSGMYFQRSLEEKAYIAGKGLIPIQTYASFKKNTLDNKLGKITPCIKGKYRFANLRDVFPEYISETIIEGIEGFSRQIKDFNMDDAILSAIESRTSSTLRIIRDEEYMSNIFGLMPCGEGAGYAGGIMSAAMDGLRIAQAMLNN